MKINAFLKIFIPVSILLFITVSQVFSAETVIGSSVENRPITSYTISGQGPSNSGSGSSTSNLILIGGIHGGYEWNSVVLAWNMLNYYRDKPEEIPSNIDLHIIPVLNPDGLHRIAGTSDPAELNQSALRLSRAELLPGRLNANGVDLNRNFDNGWQAVAYHGRNEVSAGSSAFSEPESSAVRDLVDELAPAAVIFLHSASNNIWFGGLPDDWQPAGRLARAYSEASGYEIYSGGLQPSGVPFTGTASGYLYNRGVPAIIIELANRYDAETERNIRGLNSLIQILR